MVEATALAALVAAGVRHGLVPPPLPDRPAAPFEFSADRAARYIRRFAAAPRPPGSEAHEVTRRWLERVLGILRADTLTQVAVQPSPRVPKAAVVRNVTGRLRGTEGGPAVLLVAHYDGHAASPAAADDASGVAILVEVLRALRAGPSLRHDVIALFTDAEEEGMLGARAFAAAHPWRDEVGVVINVEARGAGGRSLMFETGVPNLATIAAYAGEVGAPTTSSLFYALYQLMPNDTDFTELRSLGVPGLNFAFIGDVAAYHTPLDGAGRVDLRSVQSQGDAVLELARHFALGGPPADTAGGGNAVFFSAPLVGVIWGPLDYTWPLTAAAALLLVLAIAFGVHRGRVRLTGVAAGATGTLVATGLAAAAAVGLRLGLGALLARQTDAGVLEHHPALVLAPLALGAAAALGLLRLARRWFAPEALAAGAALLWLAAAVAFAARLPAGSYVALVPVVAVALALLVHALLSDETGPPWARWVATLAVLPVLLPLFPLMVLGLGTGLVPTAAEAALTALVAWLLAPMVAALDLPRWWVTTAALLAGAVGCSAWAIRGAHYSSEWPRPENVSITREDSGAIRVERLPATNGGILRYRIVPPPGTRRLEFGLALPPRAARLAGLDLPLASTRGGPGWHYALVGPPADTGVVFEMTPDPAAAGLELVAHLPGLPRGTPRPAGTMPIGNGDETLLVHRLD